jgi:hypothetical protein
MSRRQLITIAVGVVLSLGIGLVAWKRSHPVEITADGLPVEAVVDSDLHYRDIDRQHVLAMNTSEDFAIPFRFDASTGSKIVVESVTVGAVRNLRVFEPVAIQTPRDFDRYEPERGYSAELLARWGNGQEPVEELVVPTTGAGSRMGTVVFHGELMGRYGYVNGIYVDGTEDGERFRDFVNGSWVFCPGSLIDDKCKAYAQSHGFAPAPAPKKTARTTAASGEP